MLPEKPSLFALLDQAVKGGIPCALVTIISSDGSTPRESGAQMLVYSDGKIEGTVGGGKMEALCIEKAREAIKTGKNEKAVFSLTKEQDMLCAGVNEVFIEAFSPKIKLFICGGGHVAQKIAEVASLASMYHVVADDRDEFANKARFPGAAEVFVEQPDKALSPERVDARTYVVIVTRGHSLDKECLAAALKTDAAYIGMIGSKSKVPEVFRRMNALGLHPESDRRVFAPIGLCVGGKTPGEIAISVLAEILKVSYGKSGAHMRDA